MNIRAALGVATILALASCGGSNGENLLQNAGAQSVATRASGSYGDLLYVSMNDRIWILTYPGLSKVAEISYFHGNITASDPNNGNVIVGVGEYSHGGTQPFAYLELQSGEVANGVAFDPTTDNIAYSIDQEPSGGGWIGVYRSLNDPPTRYTDPTMSHYGSVVYDGQGNLFILGNDSAGHPLFAELAKGNNKFTNLTIDQKLKAPSDLLWDGQDVVVRNASTLLRVTLAGSTLTIVGKTKLKDAYGGSSDKMWIQDGYAIGSRGGTPHSRGRFVALWRYPEGGGIYEFVKWVSKNEKEKFAGATVSVAPSR